MTRLWRNRLDPETGPDEDIDRDMDAIVGALRERGPMTKREIGDAVGSGSWGPGRLADALWLACRRGSLKRRGKVYSPTVPAKR